MIIYTDKEQDLKYNERSRFTESVTESEIVNVKQFDTTPSKSEKRNIGTRNGVIALMTVLATINVRDGEHTRLTAHVPSMGRTLDARPSSRTRRVRPGSRG